MININFKFFYGDETPIGSHFTIADSGESQGFGFDKGPTDNTALIHGFEVFLNEKTRDLQFLVFLILEKQIFNFPESLEF